LPDRLKSKTAPAATANNVPSRRNGTHRDAPAFAIGEEAVVSTLVLNDLYVSPNGDRWTLCRDSAGNLVVSHHPNPASGGASLDTRVANFLSQNGSGPEYQALQKALADLGMNARGDDVGAFELTNEAIDSLSKALGKAVARCWSSLPQDVQRTLFDIAAEDGAARQQLAVFLHGKHARTLDALHARATSEPDSLGG
jgi:hypothetical protein